MKNRRVIVIIVLFIGIAFAPCINANVSITSVEDELVEISIDIYGIDRMQEHIIHLSEQDALELETIFNDMKLKLDNVNTNQDIIEIFNEVVVSLKEFELLPKGVSVKEVQQLVTNNNYNKNVPNNEDENFHCFIVGKTSDMFTEFIKPRWPIWITRIKFIKILFNGIITFGEESWHWGGGSGDYFREPASGWVWTKGTNGIITWESDSLWGNLGSYYYTWGSGPSWPWYEYWFYKGATGFTGITLRGFPDDRFFGVASHVAIVTEFPGKNPPIETQKSHITPYINDMFLFGKISHLRSGGYTGAYWFHIDNVVTIGDQEPRIQWIQNKEAWVLCRDFLGMLRKNIVCGIGSDMLIYD